MKPRPATEGLPMAKRTIVNASETSGASATGRKVSTTSEMSAASLPKPITILNIGHLKPATDEKMIDVWWLYDDGGLSLLVPHLLRLPGSYLNGLWKF
jgi:hypothetical protein